MRFSLVSLNYSLTIKNINHMHAAWFKKWGCTYLPVHPAGFLVTLMAIIFLVPVYSAIIRNGHSVSDDLYHLFVYTTCTAFWWKWVAEKTSGKNLNQPTEGM